MNKPKSVKTKLVIILFYITTDEFKKQYAIENSYYYLSIPYWEFDKNETYKNTITEMINNIVNTEVTQEIKAS